MEPILGMIGIFPYKLIPKGWQPCNGQLLNIQSNMALFSLLNTMYGGDGKSTFALPDLRGRAVSMVGPWDTEGQEGIGGAETVTLTVNQMPNHSHMVQTVNQSGNQRTGLNNHLAASAPINGTVPPFYAPKANLMAIAPTSISSDGGNGAAHSNMQPFLTLVFCIATVGVYPTRP